MHSEDAKVKANSQLEVLRQAAYVATHHDAVTGTEKTAVRVMSHGLRVSVHSKTCTTTGRRGLHHAVGHGQ